MKRNDRPQGRFRGGGGWGGVGSSCGLCGLLTPSDRFKMTSSCLLICTFVLQIGLSSPLADYRFTPLLSYHQGSVFEPSATGRRRRSESAGAVSSGRCAEVEKQRVHKARLDGSEIKQDKAEKKKSNSGTKRANSNKLAFRMWVS